MSKSAVLCELEARCGNLAGVATALWTQFGGGKIPAATPATPRRAGWVLGPNLAVKLSASSPVSLHSTLPSGKVYRIIGPVFFRTI